MKRTSAIRNGAIPFRIRIVSGGKCSILLGSGGDPDHGGSDVCEACCTGRKGRRQNCCCRRTGGAAIDRMQPGDRPCCCLSSPQDYYQRDTVFDGTPWNGTGHLIGTSQVMDSRSDSVGTGRNEQACRQLPRLRAGAFCRALIPETGRAQDGLGSWSGVHIGRMAAFDCSATAWFRSA